MKIRQYTHSFLMNLRESFEKSGLKLFKYRGYIPLILFVGAIPSIYFSDLQLFEVDSGFSNVLLITCVLISVLGQFVRAQAVAKSAKQTSGRNTWGHEAKSLNQTGIYSIVRHPLYLGNFFMWMGIVCYTANVWFIIVVALAFWIYYERIMFSEEAFLERSFGEQFVSWASKTPAFIPSWKNYESSKIPFSWKTFFRREYPGISSVIISFVYVDFIRLWMMKESVQWRWSHGILIFVALLYSFVFRTLKHHTSVLDEEDRS